ncbi:MAG: hypothetical protein WA152_00330 [Microgenomates group bacterium]
MEIKLKNLVIDPTWPVENPAGDGPSTPVTVFPPFGETDDDPGHGDNLDDDTPSEPNPEENSAKSNDSPDTHSK